ncbi:4619_t:CDS:2, partial [Dentiscutata heterogama]
HDQAPSLLTNDIKFLIPNLNITCIREQNSNNIYETSLGFSAEEILVGGALIIKNVSDYSENTLDLLEAKVIRIINEVRWSYKNLFTETIIDSSFPIIEDLEGNNLNNAEKLRAYVEEIYEYKNVSVIAY